MTKNLLQRAWICALIEAISRVGVTKFMRPDGEAQFF
jgi:hypothetical protein